MIRTRIRPMSAKRRKTMKARNECRRLVLDRCKGMCEVGPKRREAGLSLIEPYCTRVATDVHEILRRSQGGSITDPSNALGTCRNCHSFIGNFPKLAVSIGVQVMRNKSV